MKFESSVTAISWIPKGSVKGMAKMPFSLGITHYDPAPPESIFDVAQLLAEGRLREANQLRAYVEVEDGRIVAYGQTGRGYLGSTGMRVGGREVRVPGSEMPTLQYEAEVTGRYVRFVQTVGGRTGMPFPRLVPRAPFFQWNSATAWSTLALTLYADGRCEPEMIGASPFPRHFIYDDDGRLIGDTQGTDFTRWFYSSFGRRTPWRGNDNVPVVATIRPSIALEEAA